MYYFSKICISLRQLFIFLKAVKKFNRALLDVLDPTPLPSYWKWTRNSFVLLAALQWNRYKQNIDCYHHINWTCVIIRFFWYILSPYWGSENFEIGLFCSVLQMKHRLPALKICCPFWKMQNYRSFFAKAQLHWHLKSFYHKSPSLIKFRRSYL